MSCLPHYFCDHDDILLLEEIGWELTGQELPAPPPAVQVSVRLGPVKGIFWNRLAKVEGFSLHGVRLVVVILREDDIIATSHPSEPLTESPIGVPACGVSFQAHWPRKHAELSFDHTFADLKSYRVMLSLMKDEDLVVNDGFLSVCPCGEMILPIPRDRKGEKTRLAILPRPSPRHCIRLPFFQRQWTEHSVQDNKEEPMYNKTAVELPYLSLEESNLCLEVTWTEKEVDVEVWHADRDSNGLGIPLPPQAEPQQILLVAATDDGYLPVRVHRWQDVESVESKSHDGDSGEESPISVTVGSLDPLAKASKVKRMPETNSQLLTHMMKELDEHLDKEGQELSYDTFATNQRSSSVITQLPFLPEENDSSLPAPLKPKSKRGWSNKFRKPRMETASEDCKSTISAASSDVFSGVEPLKETDSKRHRRVLFSFQERSKTKTPSPQASDMAARTQSATREAQNSFHSQDQLEEENTLVDSEVEEENFSILSASKELESGSFRTLTVIDSLCSCGSEVYSPPIDANRNHHRRRLQERHSSRHTNGLAESAVLDDSQPTDTVVNFSLQNPPLSSQVSDLTADVHRRSFGRFVSMDRFRSLGSMSKISTRSDEITTLSAVEDRMIMKTYHSCGGQYLDSFIDTILACFDVDSSSAQAIRRSLTQESITQQLTAITEENEITSGRAIEDVVTRTGSF